MKTILKSFYTYASALINPPTDVYVQTPVGLVLGTRSDPRFGDVDSFLGIKYAHVGQRFTKSRLMNHRDDYGQVEYIDATDFGAYCWQEDQDMPYYENQRQEEECLFLNIWRPAGAPSNAKLPVMVYIHGGQWGIQGSADPPVWGHNLAREQHVIVISINYRLGIFGFLATDVHGSNGMNAFDDQVKALEWINRNVNSFGGDANLVTVFGQNVGSASVCYLVRFDIVYLSIHYTHMRILLILSLFYSCTAQSVNPSASGLFRRGIMQSGECLVGANRPDSIKLISGPEGYDITLDILDDLDATSVAELADRTLYPASEIAGARQMGDPILDKTVLPDYPS